MKLSKISQSSWLGALILACYLLPWEEVGTGCVTIRWGQPDFHIKGSSCICLFTGLACQQKISWEGCGHITKLVRICPADREIYQAYSMVLFWKECWHFTRWELLAIWYQKMLKPASVALRRIYVFIFKTSLLPALPPSLPLFFLLFLSTLNLISGWSPLKLSQSLFPSAHLGGSMGGGSS